MPRGRPKGATKAATLMRRVTLEPTEPAPSEDAMARMEERLHMGAYPHRVAAAEGISRKRFDKWMEWGELDPTSPWGRFRHRLLIAEAKGEQECLTVIRMAAAKNWCAAAWLLERKMPERWALRKETSTGPKVQLNIGIVLPGLKGTATVEPGGEG